MRLPKPRFFGNHTPSMHRSASSFIWLALVVVCGCGGTAPGTRAQPIPEPAFRWHFVGLPQLNASTNAAKLRQILALPATAKLQQEILTRSAGPLAELLMLETPGTPATTLAMQSLLPDLLQTESLIEVRVAGEMLKEWLVAVNLPDAAAADWEAKFKQLLTAAGTDAPAKLVYENSFTGWQAGRKDRSGLYTHMRVGAWSVFNFQRDGRPWLAVMAQLKATGRPLPAARDYLLALDADLPTLKKWWPQVDYLDFPKIALTITGQGDSLRTEARLRFPDALTWQSQPWQIPTNSLQDPLVSFTAVQSIEPWLRRHPVIQQMEVPFPLRQFFVWAQNDIPFKSFLALHVPDATNEFRKFAPRLQSALNTNVTAKTAGHARTTTNGLETVWLGLPIFAPFLRPAIETGGNFLLGGTKAGIIPSEPNTNPPPPELLALVTSRTNLVYYDWEITEGRLAQWRQMDSLLAMLGPLTAPPALPGGTNAASAWLDALTPLLGNTITEATIAGPHELQFIRKSHVGFTGWELVQLARWFGNADFPSLGKSAAASAPVVPALPGLPVKSRLPVAAPKAPAAPLAPR